MPETTSQITDLKLKDTSEENSDINEIPRLIVPDAIKCSVSTPKYYYIPGEQITLYIAITNSTSEKLKRVVIEFLSCEECDVARRGKDCKTVVMESIHMVINIKIL